MPSRELICALLLLSSCSERREQIFEAVEFSGCHAVLDGPFCEIERDTDLVLWVKTKTDAELTLLANDRAQQVSWSTIDGGRQTKLRVSTSTSAIELLTKHRGSDRWRLPLRSRERPEPLREAERLYRAGQLDQIEAALAKLPETDDPRISAEIESRRASVAFARGEAPQTIAHLSKSAELFDRAGARSSSINDRLWIVETAIMTTRDLSLARATLEQVRSGWMPPSSAVLLAHYQGLLAEQTGDYRTALHFLEIAEQSALRIGLDHFWWSAVQQRAWVLAALGMHGAALDQLERLVDHPYTRAGACSEAILRNNRVWIALMAREVGEPIDLDVTKEAELALALYSGPCPRAPEVANVLVNLALDAIQRGDVERARAHLARAKSDETLIPLVKLWLFDIEGRIARASGDFAAALAAYDRLASLAERTNSPDGVWRAWVGRAEVHRAMGETREALDAYARAEAELDAQSTAIAIGSARSSFIAARGHVSREHVDLLSRAGSSEEVVAAIRRSRARTIRGLEKEVRLAQLAPDQRARWDRALTEYARMRERLDALVAREWTAAASRQEALKQERDRIERNIARALDESLSILGAANTDAAEFSRPASDEVIIGFHPVEEGWIGFALTEKRARIERIGADLTDRARLLAPFEAELALARRVRFLVDGSLANVDFHALSFRGAPLIESHVVTYGIDLPRSKRSESTLATAVIVSDPSGDLPHARDEASRVARLLTGAGKKVIELSQNEVTRRAMIDLLVSADLLHYAGHGRFGGIGGWQSALTLADGASLSVGDILALARVPRAVVLSGCETAETDPIAGQQLGIAQAFVLAGAEVAVAATRPVRDDLALAIAERIHARADLPLVDALRSAQRALRSEVPDADWAGFRAIVP